MAPSHKGPLIKPDIKRITSNVSVTMPHDSLLVLPRTAFNRLSRSRHNDTRGAVVDTLHIKKKGRATRIKWYDKDGQQSRGRRSRRMIVRETDREGLGAIPSAAVSLACAWSDMQSLRGRSHPSIGGWKLVKTAPFVTSQASIASANLLHPRV